MSCPQASWRAASVWARAISKPLAYSPVALAYISVASLLWSLTPNEAPGAGGRPWSEDQGGSEGCDLAHNCIVGTKIGIESFFKKLALLFAFRFCLFLFWGISYKVIEFREVSSVSLCAMCKQG